MQTEQIHFYSERHKITGILHKPDHTTGPLPIIVQGPGWMEMVCSKVSEPFHQGFVKAGYAVLHFHSRGFGGSDGEPGWWKPQEQIEDIHNAISWVETREDLDANRLGLFGHGGSGGGNAICAAAYDQRVKCVVVQTVVADGAEWLRGMRREYEWVELLNRVKANSRRRAATNEDEMVDPTEEMMVATPERRAAKMPTYGPTFHLGSAESILRYRPLDVVHKIAPRGILLAAIENDVVTPEHHAQALFAAAGAPKKLIRQTGVTHYDAYTKNYDMLIANFTGWFDRFLVHKLVKVRTDEPAAQIVQI